MEETQSLTIRRNILNLFNNNDALDKIIIEMINTNSKDFEDKFKEQITSLKQTRFLQKGQLDKELLKVMKNKHDGPGQTISQYIGIFEKEFFPLGDKYLEIFQRNFLLNLDYHFNMRRVYSISDFQGEKNLKIFELYVAAIENFTNQNVKTFKNKYIPSVINIENEYIHIEIKDYKLEILEKIGVVHTNEKNKIKTVFVKYIFDLKFNYFEILYNENSVRDLCVLTDEDKLITLTVTDDDSLEDYFIRDSLLIGHLYSRIKSVFAEEISLQSVSNEITANTFFESILSDKRDVESQIDYVEEMLRGKEISPYEAVLFHYFYNDKEKIISNVLNDPSYENKKIEDLIKDNFSEELETEDLEASIRFLRNMTVFSKIKSNENMIRNLDDYLFMFTVRDLAVTKSTTRNEERQPIYTSDFYWHLQEVIDSIRLLNEIGMRRTVRITDGSKVFQDLKILINGSFITFTYFQHTRNKSFKKNTSDILKLAEGRNIVHDQLKGDFRKIISRESST